MINLVDLVILFIAGIGGGFLAGLLGIGGGIIYVLIFTTYLKLLTNVSIPGDVLVKLTIANSVFALIFAGLSGCYKQYRIGNFYPRIIILIGIPGIIGSITITYFLSQIDYSKEEFAIVFSILLLPIIFRMLYKKRKKLPKTIRKKYPSYIFALIGLVSGCATALSGLGGGFIIVPVANGILKFPIKKAISISLGVIAVVSFGLSIYNLTAFNFDYLELPYTVGAITFSMVIPVIAGVISGAPFGVWASQKLPGYALRIFFVIFCISVMIKLLIDLV